MKNSSPVMLLDTYPKAFQTHVHKTLHTDVYNSFIRDPQKSKYSDDLQLAPA